MALTPQQQQSVNDSGGYYDATGNWVDQSGAKGAGQGATASGSNGSGLGTLAALASAAPLVANLLKGTSQPNPGALIGTIPGGQSLVNGIVGQQAQQAPLRQAVTQQAMNMLPNSAFPGGRPTLAPVGAGPAPVQSSSGSDIGKLLAAGGAGAGLGALLAKLMSGSGSGGSGSGGGGDLGKLGQALKNLFAGNSSGSSDFMGPVDFTGPLQNTAPTANVDTSTTFNGVPGGYAGYPEDPASADPNWGGLGLGPDPSSTWGG